MKPALQAIADTISKHGHQVYLISGQASPRFAYTIGLTEALGCELVFPGGIFYMADEVKQIINDIAGRLRGGAAIDAVFEVGTLGSFRLRKACPEWVRALMLGALDYYKGREISAYQIVTDEQHWTIDTPNLEIPWSIASESAWRYFFEDWPYAVPRKSIAATTLDVLRGRRITQAARWEEELWEIFAGDDDVSNEAMRALPLGILLGADDSLRPIVGLEIGEGLERDEDELEWRPWSSEEEDD